MRPARFELATSRSGGVFCKRAGRAKTALECGITTCGGLARLSVDAPDLRAIRGDSGRAATTRAFPWLSRYLGEAVFDCCDSDGPRYRLPSRKADCAQVDRPRGR
jgi:hypothetical protein